MTYLCKKCGLDTNDPDPCFEDNCEMESSSSPNVNLTYAQAKNAIKLFDSEWIGQDPKELWEWAVSQTGPKEIGFIKS